MLYTVIENLKPYQAQLWGAALVFFLLCFISEKSVSFN